MYLYIFISNSFTFIFTAYYFLDFRLCYLGHALHSSLELHTSLTSCDNHSYITVCNTHALLILHRVGFVTAVFLRQEAPNPLQAASMLQKHSFYFQSYHS